ncbi:hypothetical protein [Nocardioides sp.]|uniref:hypothetical protein n=1 Tax=Nocardioides sp. TaxID=35761 RepID=UPI003528A53B
MPIWIQVVIALGILATTAVALIVFQRQLDRPGGRRGLGAIHDGLGNTIDVFNPGHARADRELRRHHDAGPVSRIPDDEDDDPLVILTHPDGSPRAARFRRR